MQQMVCVACRVWKKVQVQDQSIVVYICATHSQTIQPCPRDLLRLPPLQSMWSLNEPVPHRRVQHVIDHEQVRHAVKEKTTQFLCVIL